MKFYQFDKYMIGNIKIAFSEIELPEPYKPGKKGKNESQIAEANESPQL